jgi:antitoxin VapB
MSLLRFAIIDSYPDGMYHRILPLRGAPAMQTAKVFMNRGSQAIRLPKGFRVDSEEVYLKKTPEGFLVIPRDPWEIFFEGVEELSRDFMACGRQQQKAQNRPRRQR